MLLAVYGMTELSPIATMWYAEGMSRGSVGVVIPNTQAKVNRSHALKHSTT